MNGVFTQSDAVRDPSAVRIFKERMQEPNGPRNFTTEARRSRS